MLRCRLRNFQVKTEFIHYLQQIMAHPRQVVVPRLHEKKAAVSVVFRQQSGNKPQVLMIRRALNPTDRWSGQMGFPGGKHESSDKDFLATAIRETHEEIGLNLALSAKPLGALNDLQARHGGKTVPLVIFPFLFWLEESFEPKLDPSEVASLHWISLEHFFNHHSDYNLVTEKGTFALPCIDYTPVPIWGLSYLILKDVFDRLFALPSSQEYMPMFPGCAVRPWRGYP